MSTNGNHPQPEPFVPVPVGPLSTSWAVARENVVASLNGAPPASIPIVRLVMSTPLGVLHFFFQPNEAGDLARGLLQHSSGIVLPGT